MYYMLWIRAKDCIEELRLRTPHAANHHYCLNASVVISRVSVDCRLADYQDTLRQSRQMYVQPCVTRASSP